MKFFKTSAQLYYADGRPAEKKPSAMDSMVSGGLGAAAAVGGYYGRKALKSQRAFLDQKFKDDPNIGYHQRTIDILKGKMKSHEGKIKGYLNKRKAVTRSRALPWLAMAGGTMLVGNAYKDLTKEGMISNDSYEQFGIGTAAWGAATGIKGTRDYLKEKSLLKSKKYPLKKMEKLLSSSKSKNLKIPALMLGAGSALYGIGKAKLGIPDERPNF